MKQQLKPSDFSFSAGAKAITFSGTKPPATIDQILHVTNITRGVLYFQPQGGIGLSGAYSSQVLTLNCDTSGHSNSDELLIFVDDGEGSGLTDKELRDSPVPVSGPMTDDELRASPVPVTVANPPVQYTHGDPNATIGTLALGWSGTLATRLRTDSEGMLKVGAFGIYNGTTQVQLRTDGSGNAFVRQAGDPGDWNSWHCSIAEGRGTEPQIPLYVNVVNAADGASVTQYEDGQAKPTPTLGMVAMGSDGVALRSILTSANGAVTISGWDGAQSNAVAVDEDGFVKIAQYVEGDANAGKGVMAMGRNPGGSATRMLVSGDGKLKVDAFGISGSASTQIRVDSDGYVFVKQPTTTGESNPWVVKFTGARGETSENRFFVDGQITSVSNTVDMGVHIASGQGTTSQDPLFVSVTNTPLAVTGGGGTQYAIGDTVSSGTGTLALGHDESGSAQSIRMANDGTVLVGGVMDGTNNPHTIRTDADGCVRVVPGGSHNYNPGFIVHSDAGQSSSIGIYAYEGGNAGLPVPVRCVSGGIISVVVENPALTVSGQSGSPGNHVDRILHTDENGSLYVLVGNNQPIEVTFSDIPHVIVDTLPNVTIDGPVAVTGPLTNAELLTDMVEDAEEAAGHKAWLVAGSDGTDAHFLSTDDAGKLQVITFGKDENGDAKAVAVDEDGRQKAIMHGIGPGGAAVPLSVTPAGGLAGIVSSSSGAAYASTVLTSDGTNVSDGETVTLGHKTYTFKTTLDGAEGQVRIGAEAYASLGNLRHAINNDGANGTDYVCSASNPDVQATDITSTTLTCTALVAGDAGNLLECTETSAHLSFPAATFGGGTPGAPVPISTDGSGRVRVTVEDSGRSIIYGTSQEGLVDPIRTENGALAGNGLGGVQTIWATRAYSRITISGNAAEWDALTIGNVTYTFKPGLHGAFATANEVLIGESGHETMENLMRAINRDPQDDFIFYPPGGEPYITNSKYSVTAPHPEVTAGSLAYSGGWGITVTARCPGLGGGRILLKKSAGHHPAVNGQGPFNFSGPSLGSEYPGSNGQTGYPMLGTGENGYNTAIRTDGDGNLKVMPMGRDNSGTPQELRTDANGFLRAIALADDGSYPSYPQPLKVDGNGSLKVTGNETHGQSSTGTAMMAAGWDGTYACFLQTDNVGRLKTVAGGSDYGMGLFNPIKVDGQGTQSVSGTETDGGTATGAGMMMAGKDSFGGQARFISVDGYGRLRAFATGRDENDSSPRELTTDSSGRLNVNANSVTMGTWAFNGSQISLKCDSSGNLNAGMLATGPGGYKYDVSCDANGAIKILGVADAGSVTPASGIMVLGSDGTNARALATDSSGILNVKPSAVGAGNLATSQVTSTGTAATLAVARPTRREVLFTNTHATGSVWIGPATVTTSNGQKLGPGQSCPFTWVGLFQVIDDGATHCVICVADEYD